MIDRQTNGKKRGLISWRTLVTVLCFIIVVCLAAMTVSGHWGMQDWRLDKLSHFRVQYFVALVLLALFFIFTKRRVLLLLALVFAVWNAVLAIRVPNRPVLSDAPVYKAAAFNMMAHNAEVEPMRQWAVDESPDILVLIEATHTQLKLYDALDEVYPHSIRKLVGGGYGVVAFSRYPLEHIKRPYAGTGSVPMRVSLPEGPLVVIAMHPQAPGSIKAWEWRNRTFEDLAKFAAEQYEPVIVMGDMNCTPWSPFFKKFEQESGLHAPQVSWLPRRTWPAAIPPIWIPIDHFFVSDKVTPITQWTGPASGSDHYPIVMLFRVEE